MDYSKYLLNYLFDKQTKHGRVIRTIFQALLGVFSFVVVIGAAPGLYDLLASSNSHVLVSLPAWIGFISYLYNQVEAWWEKFKG